MVISHALISDPIETELMPTIFSRKRHIPATPSRPLAYKSQSTCASNGHFSKSLRKWISGKRHVETSTVNLDVKSTTSHISRLPDVNLGSTMDLSGIFDHITTYEDIDPNFQPAGEPSSISTPADGLSHLRPTQISISSSPIQRLLPITGASSSSTPTDEPFHRHQTWQGVQRYTRPLFMQHLLREPSIATSTDSLPLSIEDLHTFTLSPDIKQLPSISGEPSTSILLDIQTLHAPALQSPILHLSQSEGDSTASTATDGPSHSHLSPEQSKPPILGFPPEIWDLVFRFYMPLAYLKRVPTSHPSLRAHDASCVLRQVCRSWKAIVDYMWTLVSVRVGMRDEIGEHLVDAIRPTMLRSSCSSTLFLEVGKGRPWDQDVLDTMAGMFSQFRFISIIYHNDIHLPGGSSVEGLGLRDSKRYCNSPLPQDLQEFSWTSPYDIHKQMPRESRLPWQKLWDVNSPESALPWSNLTHLCLECPLIDIDCFNILLVATELRSVSFASVTSKQNATQLQTIYHPKLCSLKVIVDNMETFLGTLILDNLNSLDFHANRPLSHGFRIEDISCNALEHLILHCDISLEDVHELLAQCTALKHFEWYCPNESDAPTSRLVSLDLPALSSVTVLTSSPTVDVRPLITCLDESLQRTPVLNLPHIPNCILNNMICPEITTLNITKAISDQDCWLLFQLCPGLRVLVVFISESHLETSHELASIPHCLVSLAIHSTIILKPLLQRLVLPTLTTLQWDWKVSDVTSFDGLQSLLLRSNCPLERLYFIGACPAVEILTCLRVVNSSLMELTIDNSLSFDLDLAVTNDVLIHLTHGEGAVDRCLCPRLKIITLSPILSDDEVLANMVGSRWTNGCDTKRCQSCSAAGTFCDLDSLTVRFGSLHPLDRSELTALREQGLMLQFRS